MNRVSTAQLLEIGAGLSQSERAVIRDVDRLRLVTHAQLAALLNLDGRHRSPVTAARTARRVLAGWNELGILTRLQRRIGGVRRGSAGYVYYLGPVGQRLVAYWQGEGLRRGRFRPEPGSRFVRHGLSVSDLYVSARLAEQEGRLDLLAFDTEPECWRSYQDSFGGRILLKPDAYAEIGLGAYEDRYFVEVDLATESRSVIARKVRSYLDYFNSGQEQAAHGIFPRVLLATTSEARRLVLVDICTRLPAEAWQLFTVTTLERAIAVLSGEADGDRALREEGVLS
jgi:Replication-relaxation